MKVAKGTVYVRWFAVYVEDGADDPEQALMEVSNPHAIRRTALSRRRASSSALPSTRPPVMQLLATPIQTVFHVTEPTAMAKTTAATPASRRRAGTDPRLRTNLATRLIADTGQP
jgi:hypothetical protein